MQFNFPKIEEEILNFWREKKIFQKTLKKTRDPFIFYEGPPTANGRPGIHHILARSFKDIVCRYKTMKGFYVPRKAGWDTHGLPVEIEVEKEIKTKSKKDIEDFGIGKFNKKCKESVWKYKKEWEDLTERIGFWLDMENPYITYEPEYMETLFWIMKQYWEKGLLVEDKRVVPWCPRCQTSLSSHELAQGYKRVKDNSIYVKFKILNPKSEILKKLQIPNPKFQKNSNIQYPISNTYLFVWTTTPWTLPGNVAVAVNPEIDYVMIREQETESKERITKEDYYILAKERLKDVFKDKSYEVIKNFRGEDLIKLEYDPPFNLGVIYSPQFHERSYPMSINHKYRIIAGDFVSTEEGTGIVHIAPAFGEDDFKAGKENNLPPSFTTKEDGTMESDVIGEGKFIKDVDPLIIENLRKRDLLFKEELYEHDYPFCWRCKSPLIYYLHYSWFLKTTKVKEKLLENNKKINWIPEYLKYGRFGNFLEEVRDWNFSRERYWGTPLPVWKCCKCGGTEVVGSREDIRKQRFSKNRYFVLRHGFSKKDLKGVVNAIPGKKYSLTKIGREQVKRAVLKLKKKLAEQKIDIIFSSDIERCVESAGIASKEFGAKIIPFQKLREINFGIYEGKSFLNYKRNNPYTIERFRKKIEGGESWDDCKLRMVKFIEEVEKDLDGQGKNILIVSHGDPLWLLEEAMKGFLNEEIFERKKKMIGNGEIREIEFKKFPINEEGEIDFHRPYIDDVKFYCSKCGEKMERIRAVVDCWFDSGAMPFAQANFPFAWAQNQKSKIKNQKSKPPKFFPADYICEAMDQTRGWFYTLLAVSTLLGFENPYKNVISVGIVLDKKGQKMSKSRGNVINPWEMIKKYGADSVRWYFFTINQPGEPKKFDENDIKKCFNKFILTLWNSYIFFKIYALKKETRNPKPETRNKFQIPNSKFKISILDRWILSRLNNLILFVEEKLESFDIVSAAREIEKFTLEDLSKWYIRRSRRRFQKPKDKNELKNASKILGFVLLELSKLSAPFGPFLSELIYRGIVGKGKNNSVHLQDFPEVNKIFIDDELEEKMKKIREIVVLALAERKKVGIKVRQPLQKLKMKNEKFKTEKEILNLIKEEINVKEIVFDKSLKNEVELDTEITSELREEGILRDIIREIQEMRKRSGLKKENKITLFYRGDSELEKIIERSKNILEEEIIAKEISQKETISYLLEREIIVDRKKLNLKMK